MKNRKAAPVVALVAMCIGAFCAPFFWPFAEAQRGGWVEKRAGGSAFSNQLAPNPVAGYVLTPIGTDTNQVTWTNPATSLPAGDPGQVPTINTVTVSTTTTGTATASAIGTAYQAARLPSDPLGTFFLQGCAATWCGGIRAAMRWGELNVDTGAAVTGTGTCSTGSDALIATVWGYATAENRLLWPGGEWVAKLKAKVDSAEHGAAIRIEVFDGTTPWFNWTTNAFTNTDYVTIEKAHTQAEYIPTSGAASWLQFKLYATCSDLTTVSVEFPAFGGVVTGSSRIESPLAREAPQIADVRNLQATLNGKEPKLSAGADGQAVCYTGGGTSTSTSKTACTITGMPAGATPGQVPQATTGTEWEPVYANIGFDPLGTYFLHNSEGPVFYKWANYSPSTAATSTATCSSGSDDILATFYAGNSLDYENRLLWPGGAWLAKLNAHVDANGAAIRIEVWDSDGAGGESQWFNWTTGVFTNTTFETIQAFTTSTERAVASKAHHIFFKLYATCSTTTQVTIQYADGSSRIESPIAKESTLSVTDIDGLQAGLDGKEPVTSGVPGQFVRYLGTGTSTTTDKGASTVTIPTPVTTRKFDVSAGDFTTGSGATFTNVSSTFGVWNLRDAQSDSIYGAVITVPASYLSGLTVSTVWSPSATDATSTHKVRWSLSYQQLTSGNPSWANIVSWDGTTCGSSCTANYLFKESATGSLSVSAGESYALYLTRDHAYGDTYVGDVRLVALLFSYTSSL